MSWFFIDTGKAEPAPSEGNGGVATAVAVEDKPSPSRHGTVEEAREVSFWAHALARSLSSLTAAPGYGGPMTQISWNADVAR